MPIGPRLPIHLQIARDELSKRKRDIDGPEDRPTAKKIAPSNQDHETDSSSDDDFGPQLPKDGEIPEEDAQSLAIREFEERAQRKISPEPREKKETLQREEWMMKPPSRADWSGKLDPSILKARSFNSGKSGKYAVAGDVDQSLWTQTPKNGAPNEKQQRQSMAKTTPRDVETHNSTNHPKSLVEIHQSSQKRYNDNPSTHPFDKEKDLYGRHMTSKQKNELAMRTRDRGNNMFSGGGYL